MRIHGIGVNLVDLRAYTGLTWAPMAIDARAALAALDLPWPLYLNVGRLLLYDDLEGVLKWSQREGTVTRDNSLHVFNGNYALKLLTGAVAGDASRSMRSISFPGLGKFRFMCHWHAWGGDAEGDEINVRDVAFWLNFWDGTNSQETQIRYLHYENGNPQHKWQYLNAGLAWTDIPGASQEIHCGPNVFSEPTDNFLLLDVDISTGDPIIKRLISNDLDLKNLSLTGPKEAVTDRGGSMVHFSVETDVAAAVAAYFDDVALGDKALPDLV